VRGSETQGVDELGKSGNFHHRDELPPEEFYSGAQRMIGGGALQKAINTAWSIDGTKQCGFEAAGRCLLKHQLQRRREARECDAEEGSMAYLERLRDDEC
jgi:hypothetical protein